MRSDSIPLNYKLNNVVLANRYKVRQIKAFNLNLKPIICEDHEYRIDENYTPFTINSRHLPEYQRQPISK